MRDTQKFTVLIVLLLGLLASACTHPDNTPLPSPENQASEPAATETTIKADWFTVYFTDPNDPNAGRYRGGPDTALASAIDSARLSVDMAIFDLNLWSIRDSLLAAARRGVEVRIVTETDNLDEPEIQELIEAGIPVTDDRHENLMHNKFTIIDQYEVWTGSMNYSTTEAYLNNNNLIRLRSSRLAKSFTSEFEEMYSDHLFGPDASPPATDPDLTIDGTRVEVYFAPDDHPARRLVELIQDAEESIYFLAYSFTSDELAEALLESAQNGVTVAGVFEASQYTSNVGTEFDRLQAAGLDVRLDGNDRNMHHKIIILDERIVVTGSYNFSTNAETRNDENIVILHSPVLAQMYLQEFRNILAEAQK